MLYDISPPITPELSVWPGDTPMSRQILLDTARGDTLTLSTLRSTVHLGAHADGPNHYGPMPDGLPAPAIDQRSLEHYLGPCVVVAADIDPGSRVGAAALSLDIAHDALPARVLIRTATYLDPEHFNEDFAALDPALIDTLHERGVITIGIDTPSVDLFDSKDLPAHKAFLRNDMAILEGLVLNDVPEGEYELIALPLRLVGFDASPVRAVLRNL